MKTPTDYWPTVFQDPDNVGQSEYRAIHELLTDALDSAVDTEVSLKAHAISILQETEDWARRLRNALEPPKKGTRFIAEYPRERGNDWEWVELDSSPSLSDAVKLLRDAGLPVTDEGYLSLVSETQEDDE